MTKGTDYYGVLGLSRDATVDEIKKAFRRKARETHPDVNGGGASEEEFKRVNEAYEVLSDPEKRRVYDRYGTVDPRAAGPDIGDVFGGAGFGVEDIFSAFFGGGFGGAQQTRREGRDMTASVAVTLEEAARGASKTVKVTRDAPCEECEATGSAGGGGAARSCPECGGTGRRRVGRRTFLGVMESVTPCPNCRASGTVVEDPCPKCVGEGRARVTEDVTVDLPPGVADGMGIRVPGSGEAGLRGASSGDLIVTVRVRPHEYLHREGDDLHLRASVSVAQAALGAEVEVEGLEGKVTLDVPAGTQYGDTVRVRGRGMPRLRGSGRGDLVAHLAVEVPRKLDKRQRELLRELGESLGDGARPNPMERLKDWLTG